MDFTSIIGIVVGFGMLILGYSMDNGDVMALMLASAAVIVIGGTAGALILSYGASQLKHFFGMFFEIYKNPKSSINATIDYLVTLAETARKEGLLSLEKIIMEEDPKKKVDPLLKRGTLMVIDGTDLEQIRTLLDMEIYIYEQRRKTEISMFDSAAAYAPAMGMVGTIMGLIQVLQNMSTPENLTKAIAVAFITTLYGVILANLFFIPVANKSGSARIYRWKKCVIEGILRHPHGDQPQISGKAFHLSAAGRQGSQKSKGRQCGRSRQWQDEERMTRRSKPAVGSQLMRTS
jgi:chemotaxis protein MotA